MDVGDSSKMRTGSEERSDNGVKKDEEKEKRGNPLERKNRTRRSRVKKTRRKNGGRMGPMGTVVPRRGSAGQIKERWVRERTFGTSPRTKSNFGPATKLSYFPRNMHAHGRAQVFRFPGRSLLANFYPCEGVF
ncbi:hypothetical protein X777_03341 [Ooceraea biroi]|uniref:Uncharacterized protein n=1 Tax=Ooceraea biroi TaxID=2015173 RepID=A0A026WN75_OOCBI|nr:hypothetical protein X777_03341 [Ooceraea biroi]